MIEASFARDLLIETKSNRNDLVTEVDQAVEALFTRYVNKNFPEHRIFGEENAAHKLTTLDGPVWIIDPIDGTLNFVEQKRNFAISVALYIEGVGEFGVVYDVEKDELYSGERGNGAYMNGEKLLQVETKEGLADNLLIANVSAVKLYPKLADAIEASRGLRLYGAASLEYMAVAAGRAGAYLSANLAPWDVAAAKIIAEELGCVVTRLSGEEINMLEKGTSLVAMPHVYEELRSTYLK
ncbi:inositol monophosphatase [Listeria floridensis FSL S10-1187]|uniref:Inositol monophosphatase n=1 Tax=Listeria floridensis FSL S10-1187 TaxID=1265817 RepID=A0ABN0RGN6_9LIST|nr:inositol monophosphatase family protein [Listeria floridensis]EUJ33073.1 inositol monophosphatase [Listeria floridensis FSL S10-1187]